MKSEELQSIVITGASQGVGKACALACARQKRHVILVARNAEKLSALQSQIEAQGASASHFCADLSEPGGIAALCAEIRNLRTSPSALIHAAGTANSHKAEDFDLDTASRMMMLNAFAFQALAAAMIPAMKKAGSGSLVGIASVAGLRGYPYIGAYAASKHALVGAIRVIAKEVAAKGIRANAICPGYLDTEMTQNSIANLSAKTGKNLAESR
ncbi:MAG: SDR family oxidoreductase, partial [Planctomycetes bacterium]|nr:SDR family oxidoreductase [Planctomycetota bacterium]